MTAPHHLPRSAAGCATVVLAASLLAACGGSSGSKGTSTTTTVAAATSSSSSSSSSTATTAAGITSTTTPASARTAHLTALTTTSQGGIDSVRFSFADATPGYLAQYVESVTTDGEGAPVQVDGPAILKVVFRNASQYDENAKPVATIPRETRPTGTAHVRDIVRTGDFEGTLSFAIGVDAQVHAAVAVDGAHDIVVRLGGAG